MLRLSWPWREVAVAVLAGCCISLAAAQARAQAAEPLVFGLAPARHPLSFRDPSGRWMGLEVDLALQLAAALGRHPQATPVDPARPLQALAEGPARVVAVPDTGVPPDPELARLARPAHLVAPFQLHTVRGAPLDNPELSVCVLREHASAALLQPFVRHAVLDHDSAYDLTIAMADGDCRQVAVPEGREIPGAVAGGLETATPPQALQVRHVLWAEPEQPGLAPALSAALDAMQARGELAALAARWGLRHQPQLSAPAPSPAPGAAAAVSAGGPGGVAAEVAAGGRALVDQLMHYLTDAP